MKVKAKLFCMFLLLIIFIFSCSDDSKPQTSVDDENIFGNDEEELLLPEDPDSEKSEVNDREDKGDDIDVDPDSDSVPDLDEEHTSDTDEVPDTDDIPDTNESHDSENDIETDEDTPFDPCVPNPCEDIPLSNGVCIPDGENFSCGCEGGYEWDGISCIDIDECAEDFLNDCDENAECTNTTGSYFCTCNENYSGDGTVCVPDTREVDCTNTKPDNSSWKAEYADGKITQTWDGVEFMPPPDSCEWECDLGYHTEDGILCVISVREDQECTGLPDNAQWNTVDKITQTWDGTKWEPSTVGVYNVNPSSSECRFKCDLYYGWDSTNCDFCNSSDRCGVNCVACFGSTPHCKDNGDDTTQCVQCYENGHCSDPQPLCDTDVNSCVECISDGDCDPGFVCDATNSCVEDPCDPDPCLFDGTVVKLNMTEGSGLTATDSSGHGHNGTIDGAAWTTDGRFNNALIFDGDGDRIYWTYTAPENNFTMEAWVKADKEISFYSEATSGIEGVFEHGPHNYLFSAGHGGDHDAGAGVSVGTNGISVYEHGSGYMPPLAVFHADIGTDWNHIVVTYTNKQPRIYLNGELVRTGLVSQRDNVFAPNTVGGDGYGWFKGVVDHVRIYDRVLTEEEVFQSYSRSGYCSPDTGPGQYHCGCDYGWEWDGTEGVCIPRIHTCLAIPEPDGAEWNVVSEYIQKWNPDSGKWEPEATVTHYNEVPDDSSCRYKCSSGYRWNGTDCEIKPVCSVGNKLGAGVAAIELLYSMEICDVLGVTNDNWGIIPDSVVLGRANWPIEAGTVNYRQFGVKTQFGTDSSNLPLAGDNMAVLSTGRARDAFDPDPTYGRTCDMHECLDLAYLHMGYHYGNPPADFVSAHGGGLPQTNPDCPAGEGANDSVMLRVQLKVPEFANAFSFDFRFFSQEYKDWTCSEYNDFFITMLDTTWTAGPDETPIPEDKNISFDFSGNYISVNSSQFFTVCEEKDGYPCPDGTSGLNGTGYTAAHAGATRWLTTTAPVIPGEIITLRFIIWDTTDMYLDSLVLLDNFRWHAEPGTGPSTFACWDTNQNGICDPWEDINGDGVCDERDC